MSGNSYRIIYQGKIAQGHSVEEVKRNLTSLFKLSAEKMKQLFSGKKFVVAKNVDYEAAMRYKMAFETAGATCKVEELPTEPVLELVSEPNHDESPTSERLEKITCPKCGFEQEKTEECRRCGIIINKYLENREQAEEMPYVTPAAPRRARQQYFSVSKLKLVVLSLVTFGLYEIYWFYKNWKLVKIRTGQNIRPFWRAVFAIFFCYSLFKSVKQSAHSLGIPCQMSPGLLACVYIVLSATWRLPDPLWLVGLLAFLPLVSVQGVINEVNLKGTHGHEPNDRFTWGNIAVILIGGLFLLLSVIGALVPV
jgi:hypothetical protein